MCLCRRGLLYAGPKEFKKVNLTNKIHNYSALFCNPSVSHFITSDIFEYVVIFLSTVSLIRNKVCTCICLNLFWFVRIESDCSQLFIH